MIRGLLSLSILILMCLAMQASSQGYLGTVNTGTGIEQPITVGSGASPQGATVGSPAAASNLTGTMSLNLIDGVTRQVSLDIIQNGDMMLGYGNMTTGAGTERITAAGSQTGTGTTLYLLPSNAPEVYRLEITGSGASLAGRYQAFAANGAAWSGRVTGVSSQILSYRPATVIGSGANAGLSGATVGQPGGVAVQPVGQAAGLLNQPLGNSLGRNRSFFSSSNGQTTTTTSDGTTTTSDGTTTTTSGGFSTVTSDGSSVSYG